MTTVSELATTSSGWGVLVPVLAALVGALAGGFMAILGGLFAAATQHLTRSREDRARIIQQRREVLVGAWSAYRDYYLLSAQAISVKVEQEVRGEVHKQAADLYRELAGGGAGLMALAPQEPSPSIPSDVAEKLKQSRDEKEQRYFEAMSESTKKKVDSIIASVGLNYWVVMLEITCAPEVAEAYEALIEVETTESGDARKRFATAMQGEMGREPELPGLIPTLLGSLARRKALPSAKER